MEPVSRHLTSQVLRSRFTFWLKSGDPISCSRETSGANQWKHFKTDFIGPLRWFPVATDRIARVRQKVGRALPLGSNRPTQKQVAVQSFDVLPQVLSWAVKTPTLTTQGGSLMNWTLVQAEDVPIPVAGHLPQLCYYTPRCRFSRASGGEVTYFAITVWFRLLRSTWIFPVWSCSVLHSLRNELYRRSKVTCFRTAWGTLENECFPS